MNGRPTERRLRDQLDDLREETGRRGDDVDRNVLAMYLAAGVPRRLWDDATAAWVWMVKAGHEELGDSDPAPVDHGVDSVEEAHRLLDERGADP